MRNRTLAALAAAGAVALAAAGCASGKSGTPTALSSVSGQPTSPSGTPASASGAGSGAGSGSGASGSTGGSHSSSAASPSSSGSAKTSPSGPSSTGLDPLAACTSGGADPTPVSGSTLPRRAETDVQCLVDPLTATKPGSAKTVVFSRMADPSTASRGLRSWILSPYTPDLATFDQTGYGVHGDTGPSMLVAIATPKRVDGVSAKYPDFVGGILRAAGATDLYSPPSVGEHAAGYGLVITCGHETLHGRTVCVWMGTTPGIAHYPFIGTLVILSTVPTQQAETVAEGVLRSIT